MTIATTRSNTAVDIKLEVVVIPVSDVDRAKLFYAGLGWRLDADLIGDEFHIIQFTPPGSQCSVVFGSGVAPGPYARIELDILETAHHHFDHPADRLAPPVGPRRKIRVVDLGVVPVVRQYPVHTIAVERLDHALKDLHVRGHGLP